MTRFVLKPPEFVVELASVLFCTKMCSGPTGVFHVELLPAGGGWEAGSLGSYES